MPATVSNVGPLLDSRLQSEVQKLFDLQTAVLQRLRVAGPGIIQSFDSGTQTCTVSVAIRETLRVAQLNGATANTQQVTYNVATLQHVPVVLPRGGGWSITFPIKAGDECLLVYGDQCIDGWWQSGGIQNPMHGRRHSFSDAFCIPGPWSQPRVLTGYSTTEMQLRSDDGQTTISLGPNGTVTINAQTVNVTATQANVNATTLDVSGTQINVSATDSISLAATGNLVLSGLQVQITSLNAAATPTVVDGVHPLTHKHAGVTTGGGISGPPVPFS